MKKPSSITIKASTRSASVMKSIIIKNFKKQTLGLIYYFSGLFFFAWMIIAFFPSVKSVKGAYLESMPEQFLKFFGGEMSSMTTLEGFLSIEFLSLFFVLIIAFYVGSTAGSTMAGAIEKRTIDFQLSQPITRSRFVLGETIVGLIGTAILVAATVISIFVLSRAYDEPLNSKGLATFTLVATIFLWAFYGLALFFSSVMKNKISVAALTVSTLMALYVFDAMTRIVDKLSAYDKFSLFRIYNPENILKNGEINWTHLAILLSVLIVGTFSSLAIFNRKDL